jgi:hypothetical protein
LRKDLSLTLRTESNLRMAEQDRQMLDCALAGTVSLPPKATRAGRYPQRPGWVRGWMQLTGLLAVLVSLGCAAAPQRVDSDAGNGFALYRAGQLSSAELARLCEEGVEELVVLDGGAAGRECEMRQEICSNLRVRYNFAQDEKHPVSQEFLEAFDQWIEEGQAEGRKLAYRCRRGWHRAGRLTAYYQMRFMGAGVEEAIDEMQARGRFMGWFPQLNPQVEALGQLVAGEPCSGGIEVCPQSVDPTSEGLDPNGTFPLDICAGHSDSEVGR